VAPLRPVHREVHAKSAGQVGAKEQLEKDAWIGVCAGLRRRAVEIVLDMEALRQAVIPTMDEDQNSFLGTTTTMPSVNTIVVMTFCLTTLSVLLPTPSLLGLPRFGSGLQVVLTIPNQVATMSSQEPSVRATAIQVLAGPSTLSMVVWSVIQRTGAIGVLPVELNITSDTVPNSVLLH